MRSANAVLEELVLHVRPPRGCMVVLAECAPLWQGDQNWVATSGIMSVEATRLSAEKVAELCKSDTQIDWSGVEMLPNSRRRIALWLSEVESVVQAGSTPSAGTTPKSV